MLKRLLAVFTATFIALAGIAFAAELRQDHPSTYVVRKGDTLWDISAKFLRKWKLCVIHQTQFFLRRRERYRIDSMRDTRA